jgi:hypothetical protein
MRPAVTVLQLDTYFPRIAGDVGSPDSYRCDVEIMRVPLATVAGVVSARPDLIDITPFERALEAACGEVIVTSCGFLSYWQTHLQSLTKRPFISSALTALDGLGQVCTPESLMIVTFDAHRLTPLHLGGHHEFSKSIVGLPAQAHLRQVIEGDLARLDAAKASAELCDLIARHQTPAHKHILFECTNLPPFAQAVQEATGLAVTDILTQIEAARRGTIRRSGDAPD